MENRINIQELEPAAYNAMEELERYLKNSSLKPLHRELIKIRASQINGCAFCLNMHTRDARALGETEQRIYLLSAWRESDLFDKEEAVILALTEAITLIANEGVPSKLYQQATAVLGTHYLAQVIMAIVAINAWNRIAISTARPVEPWPDTPDKP